MEFRSGSPDGLQGTLKDVDSKTHECLVSFPADTTDAHSTRFAPGAFEEGWRSRKPTMVFSHRMDDPIGRAVSCQSLPHSHEIRGRFSDLDACPRARQAYSQLLSGDLDSWSFGFERTAPAVPTETRGVSRIVKARMVEFSPVVEASIPGTRTLAIRSNRWDVDRVLAELDAYEAMTDNEARARAILEQRVPLRVVPRTRIGMPADEKRALHRLERRFRSA
jgi:HK97 family phage prohead protease